MLEKTYQIGNEFIYIYCELTEYNDGINKWMKMFNPIHNNSSDKYIKIYNNKTIYNFHGVEKTIMGKILHTDLYPLFYNAISNLINDDYNMISHSAVLCYNNIGILVVGDFESGKTSLCLEADKSNIRTLSTDQTHLKIKNECLKLENGSRYMKIRSGNDIIIQENAKEVEIKIILNLIGLCDSGVVKFELIENNYHKIKTLFKYFTWHSDIPLFSDDSLLDIDRVKIKTWLTNLNVPLYNVRGNVKDIIKRIKEVVK